MTFDIDSLITRDIVRQVQAIETAKNEVRPYVGDAAMACDSVADVYATAMRTLGHTPPREVTSEPAAAKAIWNVLKSHRPRRTIAQDAKAAAARTEMFPNANRLYRSF